ncbi:VWA domain-containing protein [Clostridium thermarum]|uniref:VWA domain-containing protein n=1 Tax=Clostridium thermarum TaxID=1716543 RepID=UPI0013D33434|nr:vWA domain-containing protein [Clostridium thermarum]
MKTYNKFLIILTVLFFVGAIPVNIIRAKESEKNIIVLIDNSGSMLKNDNTRLSLVSADMLIDAVDLNMTKLNIIAFGDKVTYVKKLVERPTAEELKDAVNSIKYDNHYTNMKQGLEEALDQLKEVEGEKYIILLSDGREEVPGESKEEHEKKLKSLLKTAQDMKVRINTIGLSEESDKETLAQLANMTLGDYFFAENAAVVFDAFSNIFGTINGYYTIDRFNTSSNMERVVKISSLIEELVINVISTDENFPVVNVTNDNYENFEYKSGDRYKIYSLRNDINHKNNTIRIKSDEENESLVLVQIKSKAEIKVDSASDNFEIPYKVPLKLKAELIMDRQINDLQLYTIDDGQNKLIEKDGPAFEFTFYKDKPGYYPLFFIACDGNGNIIAGKYLIIAVTDKVPFNYSSPLISPIYVDNNVEVTLSQLDDTKIKEAAGDIFILYEGDVEPITFPLNFEKNYLQASIKFLKSGSVKLSAQIRGIKEEGDEPFFYFLPSITLEIIEKPIIEFESTDYKKPIKENSNIRLILKITKNEIEKEEKMLLYDQKSKLIKDFTVKPKDTQVTLDLGILEEGENHKFQIKSENADVIIGNSEISTNLVVLSNTEYFWYMYRVFVFIIIAVLILIVETILLCLYKYKIEVETYRINKEVEVCISTQKVKQGVNIYLSPENCTAYLNVINNSIYKSDEEVREHSIGYFLLKVPKGNKILVGMNYLLKGEKMFELCYRAISEQNTIEGTPISEIDYRPGEEIIAKSLIGNKTIKIYFY